jgi:hypothetical protein
MIHLAIYNIYIPVTNAISPLILFLGTGTINLYALSRKLQKIRNNKSKISKTRPIFKYQYRDNRDCYFFYTRPFNVEVKISFHKKNFINFKNLIKSDSRNVFPLFLLIFLRWKLEFPACNAPLYFLLQNFLKMAETKELQSNLANYKAQLQQVKYTVRLKRWSIMELWLF